jgi:predicted RecA/RadA family phage recombinase
MQNYIQPGCVLTLTAPYARLSGEGAKVGSIFGVATANVENAAAGEFETMGVVTLAKTGAQAWSVGERIYWDDNNKRADSDGSLGMLIGHATAVAANPSATGQLKLLGCSPELLEGAQGAIVALTDNTGGSATHDDTLADGLTSTAPAAVTAAAIADGTMAGAANGAFETVGATNGADVSGAIMNNFKECQTEIGALVADVTELQAKLDAAVTDLGVQNQNDSDLAQKILEIRTALIAVGILS